MRLGLLICLVGCAFLASVASACGGKSDGRKILAESTIGSSGGELATKSGVLLQVPTGVLSQEHKASISEADVRTVDSDHSAYASVGTVYDVNLGGAALKGAVTLQLPYRTSDLPSDALPSDLVAAYFDEDTSEWVPVGGLVDEVHAVLIVETTHLSVWGVLARTTSNVGRLTKSLLSGKVTEVLSGAKDLFRKCVEDTKTGRAVNDRGKDVVEACITADKTLPTFEVRNLRSFYLSVTVRDGDQSKRRMMGPGSTVQFEPGTSSKAPASAVARLDNQTLGYFFLQCSVQAIGGSKFMKAGPELDAAFAALSGVVEGIVPLAFSDEALPLSDLPRIAEDLLVAFKRPEHTQALLLALNAFGETVGSPALANLNVQALTRVLEQLRRIEFGLTVADFMVTALKAGTPEATMVWAESGFSDKPSLEVRSSVPGRTSGSAFSVEAINLAKPSLRLASYASPIVEVRRVGNQERISVRTQVTGDDTLVEWRTGDRLTFDVFGDKPFAAGQYEVTVRMIGPKDEKVAGTATIQIGAAETKTPTTTPPDSELDLINRVASGVLGFTPVKSLSQASCVAAGATKCFEVLAELNESARRGEALIRLGVIEKQVDGRTFFSSAYLLVGRMSDGRWGFVSTLVDASEVPGQHSLPNKDLVCGGLTGEVHSDPSLTSRVIERYSDGTAFTAEEFRVTVPGSPNQKPGISGLETWVRISAPAAGWIRHNGWFAPISPCKKN